WPTAACSSSPPTHPHSRTMRVAVLVALCLISCLIPTAIAAQSPQLRTTNVQPKPAGTTPRTADGHPDLTGVWNGLGDNLNGIPRGGIPSYIGQQPGYVMFIYPGQGGLIATQTMYRMIPTDGRPHTPLQQLDGTYTGEGIGHWDGDTLVVDTYGFNSNTWFDQLGGYFHSENMHVIERFHRDGNTLTWTATVEDPDVLLEPWTTTPRVALLNPKPGAMLPESQPCSERDLSHIV